MTIHLHRSNRTANAFLRIVSLRRIPAPTQLDRRFLSDIGLSQTDPIALQTR